MAGQDESPIENNLSLYAIDNVGSPYIAIYTVLHDKDLSREVLKIKRDLPRTVKIMEAQQQDAFCRTAAFYEG